MGFRSLMNITVNVKAITNTKDDYGTWTETETTRYANMPCRIQPISGREQSTYDREQAIVTHKMFCEAKYSGIREHDKIYKGTTVYDVEVVRNVDYMDHHMEIELRQLKEAI